MNAPMELDREQVMAYRIAAGGLHRDTKTAADLAVLDVGVQHTVADSVAMALAARLPDPADAVTAVAVDNKEFSVVWTHRGASHFSRTADLRALANDLWPRSEDDAIARLAGAGVMFRKSGISGLDAWRAAADALRAVVGKELVKGTVSTEVTKKLPREYGYDCRSCKAWHIYGSLFQAAGLAAGVQLFSGSPSTLAPVPKRWPVPKKTGQADRPVRAYLHLLGPATMSEIAAFLATTQKEAKQMMPADAVEVMVAGHKAFALESDLDGLRDAPAPDLVRLLPPFDPMLQPRDRELIVPDEANRKAMWRMIGNPGAVLVDGEVAGAWKSKFVRKRLTITIEEFLPMPRAVKKKIGEEAATVAAVRGVSDVDVSYGR
jgi:hypothetical protein